MKKLPLLAAMLSIPLSSCMHSVHQVHVSDYDPYITVEKGSMIKARSEQFVILGFVNDSEYVNTAYKDLQAKCPKGRVQGITTQYSTSLGFFSWTNKILMQGLCVN